jgi:hypothetical protein
MIAEALFFSFGVLVGNIFTSLIYFLLFDNFKDKMAEVLTTYRIFTGK